MKRVLWILLAVSCLPAAVFGLLTKPNSLAIDQDNNLYVLSDLKVVEYDNKGQFIRRLNGAGSIWDYAGASDEKLFYPDYIGSGPAGSLYVLGRGYLSKHGRDRAGIIDSADGHLVLSFGEYTEDDKPYGLWEPLSIAADSQGNMYIANRRPSRIKKYDKDGKFIAQWGRQGGGDGEFECPVSIAIDRSNDNVYVADSYQYWDRSSQMRIQKFTKDGKFIKKWGEHFGVDWRPLGWLPVFYPNITNIAEFDTLAGIAVDSKGFVYAVDSGRKNVTKFDVEGKYILSFGGERGSGPGQFNMPGVTNSPVGIAIDQADNIYICDEGNDRVQKFDENGKFLMEIK